MTAADVFFGTLVVVVLALLVLVSYALLRSGRRQRIAAFNFYQFPPRRRSSEVLLAQTAAALYRKNRPATFVGRSEGGPPMDLEDFSLSPMPEDNECDVSIAPVDDDGNAAAGPFAWTPDEKCDVVVIGDGDGKLVTIRPKLEAKDGDILRVVVTAPDGTTQAATLPLTAGGISGGFGFGQSAPRKIVRT